MTKKPNIKNNTEQKVLLRINSFGTFIKKEEIKGLLSDSKNPSESFTKNIIESFFERPVSTLNDDILNRYVEITTQETHVNFTPSYQNIIERVISPLVSAKRQYCLGEYLACIALTGIIGEMLALLIWRMSSFSIKGVKITKLDEEKLFGQNFDMLRQERRENILITIKAIDNKLYEKFKEIRCIRNNYMHSWDYDTRQQKGDAKKSILSAFILYKAIADMSLVVKEGNQTISINPKLLDFLKSSNPNIN